MKNIWLIAAIASCFMVASCSKKHTPQTTTAASDTLSTAGTATTAPKKVAVKRKVKTTVPKVITVDDRAAHKVADGRLYYDLEGKRYWKNYNDGKYYLFSQSMYNDPAFKPH